MNGQQSDSNIGVDEADDFRAGTARTLGVVQSRPIVPNIVDAELVFHAAMDAATNAFIVYDSHGMIHWCNRSAGELFGVDSTKILGLSRSDPWCFFVDEYNNPVPISSLPVSVAFRSRASVHDVRLRLVRAGGELRSVIASALYVDTTPDNDKRSNEFGYVVASYVDVTEKTLAEEALRVSEERWQLAVRGSTDGIWDWNLQTDALYLSERTREILGLDAKEQPRTIDALQGRIHPDDQSWFSDGLQAHLSGYMPVFTCEFRVLHGDGMYQWVHARAIALWDNSGTAYRLAGSFTDISERKQSEERLVAANSRFEALIRDLATGVLVEDSNRQVVLANQAFCSLLLLDMHPAEMIGNNCARTFAESKVLFVDGDAYIARIAEILKKREPVTSEEIALIDGRVFERDYVPVFLTEEYGGHYWMFRDITERKQFEIRIQNYNAVLEEQRHELEHANELLAALATTDGLTGVRNRRAFEERLRAEYQRSRRHKAPLSLIMLDVDKFKQYNDAFGHIEGDLVLQQVAKILEANGREYDLVARYGGEEFVVILPETLGGDAFRIAERFRRAIEEFPWKRRAITASFGVAELPESMPDPSVVLADADAAMYKSKETGRNRVTMSDSAESIV